MRGGQVGRREKLVEVSVDENRRPVIVSGKRNRASIRQLFLTRGQETGNASEIVVRAHKHEVQLAVEWYGRTLSVLITHVDNYQDRVTQLRILGEMFASTSPPALLMGDLNTTATDPPLRRILSSPGIVDAVGLKLRGASPERIDWIITRGLETVNAGMTNREASDHSMVWAEVRVP